MPIYNVWFKRFDDRDEPQNEFVVTIEADYEVAALYGARVVAIDPKCDDVYQVQVEERL